MVDTPERLNILVPPFELRKLADTTAGYVAKNGQSFELMVMEKEAQNPKFSFLLRDDKHRPYYDHMITVIARQLIEQQQ